MDAYPTIEAILEIEDIPQFHLLIVKKIPLFATRYGHHLPFREHSINKMYQQLLYALLILKTRLLGVFTMYFKETRVWDLMKFSPSKTVLILVQ